MRQRLFAKVTYCKGAGGTESMLDIEYITAKWVAAFQQNSGDSAGETHTKNKMNRS